MVHFAIRAGRAARFSRGIAVFLADSWQKAGSGSLPVTPVRQCGEVSARDGLSHGPSAGSGGWGRSESGHICPFWKCRTGKSLSAEWRLLDLGISPIAGSAENTRSVGVDLLSNYLSICVFQSDLVYGSVVCRDLGISAGDARLVLSFEKIRILGAHSFVLLSIFVSNF